MRIRSLNILRAGYFLNQVLETGCDLVVIGGRNGSGKTTLLEIIRRLIFGFTRNHFDGHLHAGETEVRAEIEMDAKRFALISIEGSKGAGLTLSETIGGAGKWTKKMAAAEMNRLLGGIDLNCFERIFAFGLDELRAPMNQQEMDLLVAAGYREAALLGGLAETFHNRANRIGATSGVAAKIGGPLERIEEARLTLLATRREENEFFAKSADLERIVAAIAQEERKLQGADATLRQLRDLASIASDLDAHRAATEALARAGNADLLEFLGEINFDRLAALRIEVNQAGERAREHRHAFEEALPGFDHESLLDALDSRQKDFGDWSDQIAGLEKGLIESAATEASLKEEERRLEEAAGTGGASTPPIFGDGTALALEMTASEARRLVTEVQTLDKNRLLAEREEEEARQALALSQSRIATTRAGLEATRAEEVERRMEKDNLLAGLNASFGFLRLSVPILFVLLLIAILIQSISVLLAIGLFILSGLIAVAPLVIWQIMRRRIDARLTEIEVRTAILRDKAVAAAGEIAALEEECLGQSRAHEKAAARRVAADAQWEEKQKKLHSAITALNLAENLEPGVLSAALETLVTLAGRALALERKRSDWQRTRSMLLGEIRKLDGFLTELLLNTRKRDFDDAEPVSSGRAIIELFVRLKRARAEADEYHRAIREAGVRERHLEEETAGIEESFFEKTARGVIERVDAILAQRAAVEARNDRIRQRDDAATRILAACAHPGTRERLLPGFEAAPDATIIEACGKTLDARGGSKKVIAELEKCEETIVAVSGRLSALQGEDVRLKTELKRLGTINRRDAAVAEISELKHRLAALVRDYGRNRLASEILLRAAETLRVEAAPGMAARADSILGRITGGRLSDARPGANRDGFEVADTEAFSTDHRRSCVRLNRGASDQLLLAVRLNRILELGKLPVVIDDSTVSFDRFALDGTAGAFLSTLKGRNQLFVLTCHPEVIVAFDRHARQENVPAQYWGLERGVLREILPAEHVRPADELARRLRHDSEIEKSI